MTVLLRLPVPWSTVERRFQHCSVSGFPLRCLRSCRPSSQVFPVQERLGLPTFFDVSLPACHGLRTPADLHLLATTDVLVLPSGALHPSASATSHFEAVPALQGARSPLRPTGCSVYASSILFVASTTATPPWTQDSIRVGGSPLPNRDFHLARDAKLSWRDNAFDHLPPPNRSHSGLSRSASGRRSGATDCSPALRLVDRLRMLAALR